MAKPEPGPVIYTRPYETSAMAELRKILTEQNSYSTKDFETFKACLTTLERHHEFTLLKYYNQG